MRGNKRYIRTVHKLPHFIMYHVEYRNAGKQEWITDQQLYHNEIDAQRRRLRLYDIHPMSAEARIESTEHYYY